MSAAAAKGQRPVLVAPVPRVAVTKPEAAAALGMSVDSFERYVMSDLPVVRKGTLRLFLVAELERWARENACRPLTES